MAASRYTRDMIARLIAAQPIRWGVEKMPVQGGVVLSPKARDRVVAMLRDGCECVDSVDKLSFLEDWQKEYIKLRRNYNRGITAVAETKISIEPEAVEGRLCRLWRRLEGWLRR